MNDRTRGPQGRWPEDDAQTQRTEQLPEHEIDEPTSLGAGVVGEGGTAVNRTAGSPEQPDRGEVPSAEKGPPAHVDPTDDEVELDEPNRWVFGGRSG